MKKSKIFGIAAIFAILFIGIGITLAFSKDISFSRKTASGLLAQVGSANSSQQVKQTTRPTLIPIGVSGDEYTFLVNFLITEQFLVNAQPSLYDVSAALDQYQIARGLPVTSTVDLPTNIVITAEFLKEHGYTDGQYMTAAIEDLDDIFNGTYVPDNCSIGRMQHPTGTGCIAVPTRLFAVDEVNGRICWHATKTAPGGVCWDHVFAPEDTTIISPEQITILTGLYESCRTALVTPQTGLINQCVDHLLAMSVSAGGPTPPVGYEGWFVTVDERICFGGRINPGVDDSVWIKCWRWDITSGDSDTTTPPVDLDPGGNDNGGGGSSEIGEAQSALESFGYYSGWKKKRTTKKVETALREFQQDSGIPVTGKLDTETKAAIETRMTITSGVSTTTEGGGGEKIDCQVSYNKGKVWYQGLFSTSDPTRTCYPIKKSLQ